jgi:hypothetical protein
MALQLTSNTLGKYLRTVRNLLNQPNAANSFWSDEELTDYLNEGIRMYFIEVTGNDEGAWTKIADLNIVSGTETVALPSDCFEVKALYKSVTNGYEVLPYRNHESDSYSTNGGSSAESYFPAYYFRENNLVLRPVPNFSQTAGLRIEYVYFPDMLQNAGDVASTNIVPIFKQLIEMYAVYKAKLKESLVNGVDTTVLAKDNLNQIHKQFVDTVQNRSRYPQFIKAFNPGE